MEIFHLKKIKDEQCYIEVKSVLFCNFKNVQEINIKITVKRVLKYGIVGQKFFCIITNSLSKQ